LHACRSTLEDPRPFLAIEPAPGLPGRFVLIVSGLKTEQVELALRVLNFFRYPYPDTASAVVRQLNLPELPLHPGPRMIYPNQRVSFQQLGFRTVSFAGLYGQQDLSFSLPPDFFVPDHLFLRLKLRFAYGAALREDSVLNILLNSQFQVAIPLSVRNGGYFRDYDVAIPLSALKPGINTITFSAAMMPLVTGRCLAVNTSNLLLTLFEDSYVEMPNAAQVAHLPDLNLLQRTGFPYTYKPYGAEVTFIIAEPDSAQAAAAWMLAGKLVQVQKLPLTAARWQIGLNENITTDHTIMVASAERIPGRFVKALPLRLGPDSQAPYPLFVNPAGPGELGILQRALRWVREKLLGVEFLSNRPLTIWTTQQGFGLGQQAVLMQARLPNSSQSLLTVLSADTNPTLLEQSKRLIDPAVWNQLNGDLFVWRDKTEYASQSVGPRFTISQASLSTQLSFILSRQPWFWAILIGLLVLLLAVVTLRLLLRFRRRHHEQPPAEAIGP
jgi:Bacterial cellulose synthase subunit.